MIANLLLCALAAASPVTGLQAVYRHGQTFVTWREAPVAADVRLSVVLAEQPITRADQPGVTVLAKGLLPGSATDWWLNPETFGTPLAPDASGRKPAIPREGWIVEAGAPRLDPAGGLFVHTVTPATAGPRYYAVVTTAEPVIEPGVNSLTAPVTQQVATPQPIWQGPAEAQPAAGAGQGLPLDLVLHAKRGRGGFEWLMFGDSSLGWREGLPFKFGVSVSADAVTVKPTDRTWIDRLFPEGQDECQRLTPAIHSFWFGYHDQLADPAAEARGTVVPYTERRLLWLVDWVRRHYGTDPQRTYCTGSSMGGCGTISFGLHHPEVFAACLAFVPIVAYDKGAGGNSAMRIETECGGLEARTSEGLTVKERLDSTRFVREHRGDLPVLFLVNGRKDGSIPWWKCPDFYRALRDQRQAVVAAWNEGDHGSASGQLPADLKERFNLRYLHRYTLDRSYLAFSHSSADDDPGNGDKANGTPAGAFGRGLEHDPPVESADGYEVVVRWYLEPAKLPVTVDVTPRRLRAFTVQPGDRLVAENRALADGQVLETKPVVVDADGLITVPAFRLTTPAHRLTLRRG